MVSSSLNLHGFCSWTKINFYPNKCEHWDICTTRTESNANIELAGSIHKLATDPKINHHHKNTIKFSKWLLEEELAAEPNHIYRWEQPTSSVYRDLATSADAISHLRIKPNIQANK